jgi:hypothetical protein
VEKVTVGHEGAPTRTHLELGTYGECLNRYSGKKLQKNSSRAGLGIRADLPFIRFIESVQWGQ